MNQIGRRGQLLTVCAFFPLLLAVQSAQATAPGFYTNLFAGMSELSLSNTDLVLSPIETDRLEGNQNNTEFTPGIGFGYNFTLVPEDVVSAYLLQSIAVSANLFYFQTDLKGDVLQFDEALFNNYTYKMNVKSTRLMLDSEWNSKPMWYGLTAFAQVGIGAAYNTVDYQDKPKTGIIGGGLTVDGSNSTNFAYDLGLGLKLPITLHSEISLRYVYTGLGSTKTSTDGTLEDGTIITLETPIKVDLTSQALMFGYSYYFG